MEVEAAAAVVVGIGDSAARVGGDGCCLVDADRHTDRCIAQRHLAHSLEPLTKRKAAGRNRTTSLAMDIDLDPDLDPDPQIATIGDRHSERKTIQSRTAFDARHRTAGHTHSRIANENRCHHHHHRLSHRTELNSCRCHRRSRCLSGQGVEDRSECLSVLLCHAHSVDSRSQ